MAKVNKAGRNNSYRIRIHIMPRKVYETDQPTEIQQGCIFSGAIAIGYEEKSVYGLIITPRCDIEQNKVRTVHYIPMVDIEDWKRIVLTPIYQEEELDVLKAELSKLLEKYKIPTHLMDVSHKLDDDTLIKLIPSLVRDNVIPKLHTIWELQDPQKAYEKLKQWRKYKDRISNLIDGRNERYLLFEKWNNEKKFLVLCLTEINRLSLQDARRLINGLKVRDINYDTNDLRYNEDQLVSYKVLAKVTSPFIEYITQHLSNAFFRIGVEDFDNKKEIKNNL